MLARKAGDERHPEARNEPKDLDHREPLVSPEIPQVAKAPIGMTCGQRVRACRYLARRADLPGDREQGDHASADAAAPLPSTSA
jgi:hypothetical protein